MTKPRLEEVIIDYMANKATWQDISDCFQYWGLQAVDTALEELWKNIYANDLRISQSDYDNGWNAGLVNVLGLITALREEMKNVDNRS